MMANEIQSKIDIENNFQYAIAANQGQIMQRTSDEFEENIENLK